MERFTNRHNLSLAYYDEGKGKAVICLAGLSRNARDFEKLKGKIDLEAIRLIRFDFRGRGQSDWDEDYTRYTIEEEAKDVIELMDHLQVEKAHFVGVSRGGLVSMVLGKLCKERVEGVYLSDIGPVIEANAVRMIAQYLGTEPDFQTHEELIVLLKKALGHEFPTLTDAEWLDWADRITKRDSKTGKLTRTYDPNLAKTFSVPKDDTPILMWDIFDALLGVKVALVRAENSTLLSRETVVAMKERHPGLMTVEAKNRGHIPLLDEPECISLFHQFMEG